MQHFLTQRDNKTAAIEFLPIALLLKPSCKRARESWTLNLFLFSPLRILTDKSHKGIWAWAFLFSQLGSTWIWRISVHTFLGRKHLRLLDTNWIAILYQTSLKTWQVLTNGIIIVTSQWCSFSNSYLFNPSSIVNHTGNKLLHQSIQKKILKKRHICISQSMFIWTTAALPSQLINWLKMLWDIYLMIYSIRFLAHLSRIQKPSAINQMCPDGWIRCIMKSINFCIST